MGYAHILFVYEDGLQPDSAKARAPVGDAVVSLCTDESYHPGTAGPLLEQIRSAPVLDMGNCVNHVGAVHSSDEEIFVWSGNCLRSLRQLDDKHFDEARALFDARYAQRKLSA